jgi:hypothetical protein
MFLRIYLGYGRVRLFTSPPLAALSRHFFEYKIVGINLWGGGGEENLYAEILRLLGPHFHSPFTL